MKITYSKAGVRVIVAIGAALGACQALAACSADEHSAASAARALSRPVTAQEARLLDRAEQVLTRACMAGRGFELFVVPKSVAAGGARFAYVVDDVAWARRHGYGRDLDRRLAMRGAADPNQRYFAGLSAARRKAALRALNGARPLGLRARLPNGVLVTKSDRSCTSQAQRALYGDLALWFRVSMVTQNLRAVRFGRVVADRQFAAALRRWARCMRAAGHRYENPGEARDAATRSRRRTEKRIAVAEATCAHATGLGDVAQRLDRRYAAVVLNEHRLQVRTARSLQRAALPRARQVTRGE